MKTIMLSIMVAVYYCIFASIGVHQAAAFEKVGINENYSSNLFYPSAFFVVANPDNDTYLLGIYTPVDPSRVLTVDAMTGQPKSAAVVLEGAGVTGFDAVYNATNKEYLVVTMHSNYPSGDNGVYGQFLDINGQLKGVRFLICPVAYSYSPLTISWNSADNKYAVFWGHSTGFISGMILNADGSVSYLAGNVTSGKVGAGNPDVVYNADANTYLLVFNAFFGVYGRLFDSAGNSPGGIFKIDEFTADSYTMPGSPQIAYHPGVQKYLVVWPDKRDGPEYPFFTIPNIYGQLLNSDGSDYMGNFAISTLPENEFMASVSSIPGSDKFLVSWIWDKSGSPVDQYVLGREVAAADQSLGPVVAISEEISVEGVPHAYVAPSGTATGCLDEKCLLAWVDERAGNEDGYKDIYGQRIGFVPPELVVDVDIKPGNEQNYINTSSEGVFPLAIFSSEEFDATKLIPESISLAGSFVKVPGNSSRYLCHDTDVNNDGITDLLCQVDIAGLTPEAGTGRCRMTAMSLEETRLIVGEDFVTFK